MQFTKIMKKLQFIINKRLIKKHLWNTIIAHITKKSIKEITWITNIKIIIKNNTIFVYNENKFDNIQIFLNKKNIINKSNEYIKALWLFNKLSNIIIK